MGAKKLSVTLLRHTPDPQEIVAMGAKLCYSPADIEELKKGIEARSQAPFLGRLMEFSHLSPIEHASFTFGIEGVSRSLLAQITRHRIASFSVKSQRYVSEVSAARDDDVFGYIIPPRIAALGPEAVQAFADQMRQIQKWYDEWVEKLGNSGESTNEDARFVLPNAAETKMLVTMNARELLHFFNLRCCNRAQWEIRALATEMLRLAKQAAPVIFKEAGPGCLQGPCPEGKKSCGKSSEVRERFKNL
ncbi:FAD-dependent thymidylate synthase [Pelotomaculum propionicicum]|uniref:Flavin-dependent thymidylate synthase n=1 Tax=Pelotomaculum propionicicum TaxID=258475 RepID=A0A4Y7RKI8_9FIRM|nr:FAD-dependent thymidylate synthase [Pelotomaculum propionicicum]NLI11763.1 FAD-dependent thymidylate synthase [Peptococcaceae bacterium]TEB09495.1 Flavin-dependent thymidylate synthase [Pelotomaculum propionicicum]